MYTHTHTHAKTDNLIKNLTVKGTNTHMVTNKYITAGHKYTHTHRMSNMSHDFERPGFLEQAHSLSFLPPLPTDTPRLDNTTGPNNIPVEFSSLTPPPPPSLPPLTSSSSSSSLPILLWGEGRNADWKVVCVRGCGGECVCVAV